MNRLDLIKLKNEFRSLANPEKAKDLQRFFKTGKGEYGEGDLFLGIMVPETRKIAKKYIHLKFEEIENLLKSEYHEERLLSVIMLVLRYKKAFAEEKEKIFKFYLKHTKRFNNWDLVDLSAPYIVGPYLEDKDKDLLLKLSTSKNLWERRISIMSTFQFIKKGDPEYTFRIARILLNDTHDLIHKAVGWMLREVGKRISVQVEEEFLIKFYKNMPRTMLRYAIEKFPEQKRQRYLKGVI